MALFTLGVLSNCRYRITGGGLNNGNIRCLVGLGVDSHHSYYVILHTFLRDGEGGLNCV